MLAIMFTYPPEAISIWAELVQRQKDHIQAQSNTNLYPTEQQASLYAAQQDISRSDLAHWDASARAWLQSADQVKGFQNTQTRLILESARVPVNNEPSTYSSVMKAWTVGLQAMN